MDFPGMKKLAILLAMTIVAAWAAGAAAKPLIIWQWIDEAGKVHYTDNFNAIPQSYRARAVQGVFLPDKKFRPGGNNTSRPPGKRPKPTNKLEMFGEKYFEKDGILILEGKVRNGFAQPISNIKVKATFYDAKDAFVKEETTFLEPIQLKAGEEGKFAIEIPFSPDISSYKAEVYWE